MWLSRQGLFNQGIFGKVDLEGVQERYRVNIPVNDSIEYTDNLAYELIYTEGVIMLFHYVKMPLNRLYAAFLGIDPCLQFLVGTHVHDVLYEIKRPSLGPRDNTIPLKDLL